ncbi:MAG: BatA domain-containing protein [Planctomycetota bacterium]|jgi:hypothetical protein
MTAVTSILAFGFSSPALLTGLLLAGIPVLIHLLHRRRYVEHRWAAMQFLVAAMKRESRRVRLQNLILLLLRTLVIAGLVLAFARPFIDGNDGVLNAEEPAHRILVIDTSFSMQFEEAADAWSIDADSLESTGTRFGRAQQVLRRLVADGRRGDAWNLVRTAGAEPLAIVGQPSFRPDSVLDEIDQLKVADAPGDLYQTLSSVLELTQLVPELSRKEVVIVSDLQAQSWAPATELGQQKLSELVARLTENARVAVINVGSASSPNAAVVGLTAGQGPVIAGRSIDLSCSIRNFGSSPLRDQIVELLIDGRVVDTRRVELSPGIDVPVEFSPTIRDAGRHVIEVRLEADSLPVDNRRWHVVDVREELRVLLVDGRPAGRARDRASFYLERALAPPVDSQAALVGSVSEVRPHVVTEADLPSVALDDYDAVVLCDVGLLTEQEAAVLEAYVRSGGGLVIFPGDRTQADSYNTRLYRDGAGVLPAALGEQVSTTSDQDVLTFDARGFAHPLVSAFRGNPNAGLESTMTVTYQQLTPHESTSTALWFSDGSPALVERQAGDGRVVLAATGADDRWGTWAIWAPSFVPMMHETVRFAAAGASPQSRHLVGEPVTVRFDEALVGTSVSVRRPDESRVNIPVLLSDDSLARSATAVIEATSKSGVYSVETTVPQSAGELNQRFAVNVAVAESDLAPVDQQRLVTDLYPGLSLRTVDAPASETSDHQTQAGGRIAVLSRLFAWLVLLGLLAEPFVAWRFSTGVAVFAGLLVATIALQFGLLQAAAVSLVCVAIAWLSGRRPRAGVVRS